jgi:signal transduction histidine kinase
MARSSTRSVKHLLLTHELALVLLVLVTGALGGAWGVFWRETSGESARLATLNTTASQIRSDLFRQIKEVTLARLMEDERALKLYSAYSRQIDTAFNALRKDSGDREEQQAIQDLQQTYRVVQQDMNSIFNDPYRLNRVAHMRILDPRYEQELVGEFDRAYAGLEQLLNREREHLEQVKARWMRWMPVLLPVPLLLAGGLVWFSRRQLQRGFVRPMQAIMAGANSMREGQLDQALDAEGVQEVGALAENLNALARDLKHSRRALVEAEKQAALGALVPVVAHNIRNPLAAIRATAQVLDPADSAVELLEARTSIIDTVDRLGRWVTALLVYLHPAQVQLRSVAPSSVGHTVAMLLQARAATTGVTLNENWPATEPEVPMDVDLVEQGLAGLVANAIEASPPGGTVVLCGASTKNSYLLSVFDAGQGLPFSPRMTLDLQPGQSTKRMGTGLGIPFAQKVCSLHGWSLDFMTREMGGTCVEIGMPLDATRETKLC